MGRFGRVLAAASVAILVLAACGDDDDDASDASSAETAGAESTAPPNTEPEVTVPETTVATPDTTAAAPETTAAEPDTTAAADPAAAASERLAVHYEGTDRALPDSSPTPEPGKNVWVIPCASAAEGCAIPANAIADAGAQIGWDVTVSDGGFDPTVQSNAIRSAIADDADAIVLIAVDCPNVVTAAQEAKDAGILLYSDFSLDCNEGADGPQLFDGWASFDTERSQYSTYLHDVRAQVATDWVIATVGSDAKVMIVDQTDLLNAQIEKQAFEELFAANCPDCALSTVEFTGADLLSGNLRGIVAAGIAADPSVDVLIAPYDASISLGIGPAVAEADGDYLVVGYEGLSANMAEIKAGGPTSMSTGFPSQWVGWQTVDELIRLFAGEELVDQGMGWQAVDSDHNIPSETTFYDGNVDESGAPRQDYQANFLRLWGSRVTGTANGLDQPAPILSVTGLSKTYGTIRVLSDVSLAVNSREVHAIVGGNGSGKSTSVKLLAGVIPPDPGMQLEVHGAPVPVGDWSPDAAWRAHLRFVHQDLGLFAELSIADNLFIGSGYDAALMCRVRRRDVVKAARVQLRRIGVEHDPRRRLSTLTLAEQSLVAIARALRGVDDDATACMLLDEPTAALPAHDRQNLLDTLRRLADAGHGVLLVTHHIDELLAIADRVTVLRDGHLIHTGPVSALNRSQLIELITGNTATVEHRPPIVITDQPTRLRLDDFSSGASRSVSLEAKQGEILGLAGLPGSGCDDVAPALFGLQSIAAGTVWIDDQVFVPRHPARAMQAGIAFLPADRQRDGVFAGLSVLKNLTAASTGLAGRWRLHHRRERRRGQILSDQYRVRPADVTRPIGTLSGGNQQKVLLGRWGCRHPRLLLLEDPTRGVDVGARQDIWRLLTNEARSGGLTIIVTSSEVEELATFCDRIVVFRSGQGATELRAGAVTASAIAKAMYESDASGAAA